MNTILEHGKYYRVIPAFEGDFVNCSTGNEWMLRHIKEHGGSFTPKCNTVEDGTLYVTEVEMADGTRLDSDGYDYYYFELEESEFRFFEEVTKGECKDCAEGLISMKIEVNQQNFEAMIDLIKRNFKK